MVLGDELTVVGTMYQVKYDELVTNKLDPFKHVANACGRNRLHY